MFSGNAGLFVGRQNCVFINLVLVLYLDVPARGDRVTLSDHLAAFNTHRADIWVLF